MRPYRLATSSLIALLLTLAALFPCHLSAQQVQAELILEQDHFLGNEPIKVAVKITNFSGRTLKLGETQEWLQFSVEGQNNQVISRIGEVPVIMPFDLENSHVAKRKVDIAPYFDLQRSGRYKLTATVTIPQINRQIATRPAYVDIVSGTRVWEQEFGLNRPGGASETRKYVLLLVTQKNVRRLYVRITDADEGRSLRTFPIGNLVSFNNPEKQLDSSSKLHVLSQYGSRSFNYCVIDPDGELVVRQTYEIDQSGKPGLGVSEDGQIIVKGGVRRKTEMDIPEASAAGAATSDAPSAKSGTP